MRTPISFDKVSKHLQEIKVLKKAFDLLPDHVIVSDEHANILYANKAVEHNTGFSQEETIGKNPADLWGGKMPKRFYEEMWRTIKIEKKPFVGEVQNMRKDGTTYWQEVHISPVLDEDGNIKFFIGIEPNITERKKREQFKEEFISAIGHQARNPLAAIQWMLESLLGRVDLKDEERSDLQRIYREDKTLANLIKDLLILSRVEDWALEEETVRVDEELVNIIEIVKQKHPDISFSFQNNIGSVPILAVKSLTLQVFSNIIHNAAEHANKERGEVTVKLEKLSQGMLFSCHNNGGPMPPDIVPKIFTKVSSTSGGAGLGLYIVKMISDYLTWRVSFETGENGTVFHVMIPWPNQ